ncbi:hypothetical protein Taro_036568 [Colocasia esculenta]|uniref:Uncharacterized protein n=1 Tax=Colocasia esculenta TaxID=4460 RepID=A0A843WM13_COLES|nr:hypothetical protein [Colocasia esculenta]
MAQMQLQMTTGFAHLNARLDNVDTSLDALADTQVQLQIRLTRLSTELHGLRQASAPPGNDNHLEGVSSCVKLLCYVHWRWKLGRWAGPGSCATRPRQCRPVPSEVLQSWFGLMCAAGLEAAGSNATWACEAVLRWPYLGAGGVESSSLAMACGSAEMAEADFSWGFPSVSSEGEELSAGEREKEASGSRFGGLLCESSGLRKKHLEGVSSCVKLLCYVRWRWKLGRRAGPGSCVARPRHCRPVPGEVLRSWFGQICAAGLEAAGSSATRACEEVMRWPAEVAAHGCWRS